MPASSPPETTPDPGTVARLTWGPNDLIVLSPGPDTAAAAAWREEAHPRIPGGKGGGEFTHGPGGPGEPHVVREEPLRGGSTGATLVHLADGSRMVRKRGSKDSLDREELAAKVGAALGALSPQVHRAGPEELFQDHVTGDTGTAWRKANKWDRAAMSQLTGSDSGRKIGQLDYLTENNDRGINNWMVDPQGRAVPIDNSAAFSYGQGWYGSDFAPDGQPHFTPSEVPQIRERLQALHGDFTAAGHEDWYRQMIAKFEAAVTGPGLAAAPWREEQHPRGYHGRFGHGEGPGGGKGAATGLAAHVATGIASEKAPASAGKSGAAVAIATLGDGTKVIHKTGMSAEDFDHEQLAGAIADAIGNTGAPPILRPHPGEAFIGLVPGEPAVTWMTKHGHVDPDPVAPHDDLTQSFFNNDRAARIGLLDLLVGNEDRHWGNWFINGDDPATATVSPIDHGLTLGAHGRPHHGPLASPFMRALLDRNPGHFTPADLDGITARLAALDPQFAAAGHPDWHQQVMANLASFRQFTKAAP